jgi:hypothetical protein
MHPLDNCLRLPSVEFSQDTARVPSELAIAEDGDDMENDSPPARTSEQHLKDGDHMRCLG